MISIATQCTANLPPLPILKKIKFCFQKKTFFSKRPNFRMFEKSYYFSRLLWQICYNLVRKKFQIKNRPEMILPGHLASDNFSIL